MDDMGGSSSSELRSVYFDFDDHNLRADARETLKGNAAVLTRSMDMKIVIQGNCDERGSEEYNLALGQKRADAARRFLIDLGVTAARISTISFGEEKPAVQGHNETAWAQNRRDDFAVR